MTTTTSPPSLPPTRTTTTRTTTTRTTSTTAPTTFTATPTTLTTSTTSNTTIINKVVIYITIIFCCIISYYNSLEGELCFDDMFAILHNSDTSPDNPYPISNIFTHDFWGHDITSNSSHKSYRPICILYFRSIRTFTLHQYLNYPNHYIINNATTRELRIHPEYVYREKDLQPLHLHMGNLCLHIINSILLYVILNKWFANISSSSSSSSVSASSSSKQIQGMWIWMTSLLFATHPIHTEAVTGLVGAAELLACAFGFLSLYCYMQFPISLSSSGFCTVGTLGWMFGNAVFFYLAVLSKESAASVAGLMVIYSVYHLLRTIKKSTLGNQKKLLLSLILWILCPFLWVIGFAILRKTVIKSVMSIGKDIFLKAENPIAFENNRLTRILSTAYIHSYYLRLLFVPYPLSPDYSFNCIPLVESWSDPRNIISLLCYLLLFVPSLIAGVLMLKKILMDIWSTQPKSEEQNNSEEEYSSWHIITTISWLILPFLPASNIFFYVGTFVAERLLYVPSIGFCMGLALFIEWFIGKITTNKEKNLYTWAIVGAILVVYVKLTYDRNMEWVNEEVLFRSAYEVCPDSVNVLQNHGILDRRYMKFDEALRKFTRAKQIDPTRCRLDHWIAITLINKGEFIRGYELLQKSLDCRISKGESLQTLQKLVELLLQWHPGSAVLLHDWGKILLKLSDEDTIIAKGAYDYYHQALNNFILYYYETQIIPIAKASIDSNINNFKNEHNNKDLSTVAKSTQAMLQLGRGSELHSSMLYEEVGLRLADIVQTLNTSVQHKSDCFLQTARYIVTWEGLRRPLIKHTQMTKLQLKQLRKLSQNLWSFISKDNNPCKQEREMSKSIVVVPKWQRTHIYMAKQMLHVIVNYMTWYIQSYPLGNKSKTYWNAMITKYSTLHEKWSEEEKQVNISSNAKILTSPSSCEITLNETLKWFEEEMKFKNNHSNNNNNNNIKKTNKKNKKKNRISKSNRIRFLTFEWLMQNRKEVEEKVRILQRQIIDNIQCTVNHKIWALDAVAKLVTPFVDMERKTWNFDGCLDYYTKKHSTNSIAPPEEISKYIQWISELYTYIMEKMQTYKISQLINNSNTNKNSDTLLS